MMDSTIQDELVACLTQLPASQQLRVLEFAQSLRSSPTAGTRGADLLSFVGVIDEADLQLMAETIQEECSRVDTSEW